MSLLTVLSSVVQTEVETDWLNFEGDIGNSVLGAASAVFYKQYLYVLPERVGDIIFEVPQRQRLAGMSRTRTAGRKTKRKSSSIFPLHSFTQDFHVHATCLCQMQAFGRLRPFAGLEIFSSI